MTILKTKEEVESLLIKLHGSADQELVKTLWGAVSRNIRPGGRDSKYWDDGATGYQTCPLTGMRKARFDNRTVAVLGLTYDAYVKYLTDNNLPIPAKTNGFMDEVNAKLKKVDPSTGKSKREEIAEATKSALSAVGDDGLTGYERKGLKTKLTHMANVDDNGLNGYERLASSARTKQNETMGKVASTSTKERFRYFVDWLGARHRDELLVGKIRGVMGTEGAEQVDHIFPVSRGYDESISPWVLANPVNMHVVPWQENASRAHNDVFTKQSIHDAIGYDSTHSKMEFDLVISILEEMDNYSGGKLLELFNERSSIPKYRF